MHLWTCFISLNWDIKCWDIKQRWLISQASAAMFNSRGLASPSNEFGLHAGEEENRELTFHGESALTHTSSPLVLWKDYWEHLWSPATCECDVLLASVIQTLWQLFAERKDLSVALQSFSRYPWRWSSGQGMVFAVEVSLLCPEQKLLMSEAWWPEMWAGGRMDSHGHQVLPNIWVHEDSFPQFPVV